MCPTILVTVPTSLSYHYMQDPPQLRYSGMQFLYSSAQHSCDKWNSVIDMRVSELNVKAEEQRNVEAQGKSAERLA